MAVDCLAWLSMDAKCSSHREGESYIVCQGRKFGPLRLFLTKKCCFDGGTRGANDEIQVTIYDEVGNVLEASVSEDL